MKSLPLLNGRTTNPSEASKRPVALSIMGSSSTRQTISDEGCLLGVMRICATVLFSCCRSEREPHGSQELFVVKRFVNKGRSPRIQGGATNQWIVLSSKDDDASRR